VDWDVVSANPKVFSGYSDITLLHLAIEKRGGFVTFHGPVVTTLGGGLSQAAARTFWRAVERAEPLGKLESGDAEVRTLVKGRATGRLAGGCITLLAAAVGTPEHPDLAGRIVILEDTNESAYRIDRYIMQLLRAGILQQAAGFIIGTVTGWEREEQEPPVIGVEDVWRDLIAPLGKPAIYAFPFGHEPDPITFPLGCMAELDADSGTVTVLEPAVE
jgi:muramoyltetrapeptide carboxypeptidase